MEKPYRCLMEVSSLLTNFDHPVKHSASTIAPSIVGDGDGVRICVIGSGKPNHSALPSGDAANFTHSVSEDDLLGHATVVTGILGSNNPETMVGMVPEATYLYAKAIDDESLAQFNAVIASVLWAIIKEAHLIICPLSSDVDNSAFHDAIKKAHGNGICIVAAANNQENGGYPAVYKEVLSVSDIGNARVQFKAEKIASTYLEDTFVHASGTPVATAMIAGVCAAVIGNFKSEGKRYVPKDIYAEVTKALNI